MMRSTQLAHAARAGDHGALVGIRSKSQLHGAVFLLREIGLDDAAEKLRLGNGEHGEYTSET